MADVNINKFRASVVRDGSKPASPGFIVSEGQDPVDPAGNGQNHLPVTIATAATGLSITDSQVLGGAGTVGQYIRGDGSLADFPATTGGGSSVSYYLNGSVSQGTIGGVAYKELNRTPIFGAGTDISINADGYIASFITDAGDPNKLLIPAGNWNLETYFSASSSGGTPSFYVELYKYNGTTFTLIATSSSAPELIAFGTNLNPYFSTLAVPETVLALTDRLALRYYVTHSGRTITLHTENNHLCQVITTFTTGLTALNGLTSQVQYLTVGTSGTDFAISSVTDTHTFNLPTASATNRGALSSADWTTFNGKQNALTNPVTGTGSAGQVAYWSSGLAITGESNLFWDATNDRLGIGTNVPATAFDIKSLIQLDSYSAGTVVAHNSGYLRLISQGKTGWAFGDELGKIEFFGSDTSGIGARNAASIRAQNTEGNGSVGNTTFNGELLFFTSTLNSLETEKWRIKGTGVLQSNGAQTIQTSTGNLTLATGGGNGDIVLSPNGSGDVGIFTATPDSFKGTASTKVLAVGTTTGNNGVNVISGTTSTGSYMFSDSGGNDRGGIIYYHTVDLMTLTTNGAEAIRIFSDGNTFIGSSPSNAGYKLDVNGTARVQGVLTTTADAVVNGVNIGLGGGAITSNTRFGLNALLSNTTGSFNTAIGSSSLRLNTTGSSNTASGLGALRNNTTGNNNTANGLDSLLNNTTGDSNSAFGRNSLLNNITGAGNLALGLNSGRFIADGTTALTIANNSVFLGLETRAAADNQTNQIVIGHAAIGLGSNTTVIGNTSTTHGRWYGNLLIGTSTNSGFQLDVNGTGRFSGNLGVGITSFPSWASGTENVLQVKSASIYEYGGYETGFSVNAYYNLGWKYIGTNVASQIVVSNGAFTFNRSVSGTAGNAISWIPSLTIASSGNVLIGTTTDNGAKLQVNGNGNFSSAPSLGGYQVQALSNSGGSTSYGGVIVQSVNGKAGYLTCGDNSTATWYGAQASFVTLGATLGAGIKLRVNADDNTGLAIGTNGIIDMAGPLVVRGTLPADQTDAAVIDHFSNTMRIFSYGAAGVTGDFQFRTAAGGAGSNLVSTINGTTGVYTAVSDINKKKDFEESTIGLDAILGLKPTLYRMKSETNTQKHLGFIAQEVRQYIPNAYVENGEFIGLNEMPIIAALTKAIQELKQEIDTLKN